jgi:CRP-like cAMP-binding protein
MTPPYSDLLAAIGQKIVLSDPDKAYLLAAFQPLKRKKSEYLLRMGDSCQHLYFVSQGYLRHFHTNELGTDVTTEIVTSPTLVTAFESFLQNTPSSQNIQCLTPCELLRISKGDYDTLYTTIAQWPLFCQQVYEKHILRMSQRLHLLQCFSATERYETLLTTQPEIMRHTPVKHLASYLGIQPQSLSRIRKNIK